MAIVHSDGNVRNGSWRLFESLTVLVQMSLWRGDKRRKTLRIEAKCSTNIGLEGWSLIIVLSLSS